MKTAPKAASKLMYDRFAEKRMSWVMEIGVVTNIDITKSIRNADVLFPRFASGS